MNVSQERPVRVEPIPTSEQGNGSLMTISQGESHFLISLLECLLFVAGEPATVVELAKVAEVDKDTVAVALSGLRDRLEQTGSGLRLLEIAGGWQLATRPEYAPFLGKFLAPGANRLSRPALETVTIIAYRQPCTQAEVEAIRGVAVDGVLKTLLERDLVKEAGRKNAPGRPILYGTTEAFLHYFGMASLADLPALEEDESPETVEAIARTVMTAASIG